MTTPVDIDKLKELLAKCDPESADPCEQCGGYGEWFAHSPDCHNDSCALAGDIDDCSGQVEQCYCQDKLLVAAQISLPALIAKAERVDALEAALRKHGKHDGLCARIGGYGYCSCGLEAELDALSPKPEISDPTKRMEKILGAPFTLKDTHAS